MLAASFLARGQGLGLAVPAVQQGLQHLLCLQGNNSSSSSSAAAFASKAKAEPAYKKDTPKKARKLKTVDKPRRAVSAYAFFVKEQASARKGEDGLKPPGLLKKIAGEWLVLQELERQPYVELAVKSKAQAEQARGAQKSARGPPTAYNTFCGELAAELRAGEQQMTGAELLKEASVRWSMLPTVEKERRKAAAKEVKDAWKAQQK